MYRFSLWEISFRSWSIETQNFDLGDMFWTTAFENHRQEDISPWSKSRIVDRSTLEDKCIPFLSLRVLIEWGFWCERWCLSEVCANVDCMMSRDQMQIKIGSLCRRRMSADSLCPYRRVIWRLGLCLSCRNICCMSIFSVLMTRTWDFIFWGGSKVEESSVKKNQRQRKKYEYVQKCRSEKWRNTA